MIGQEHFLEKLNKYNLTTFPHSVLLLGDKGSGQIEMCDIIGNKLGIGVFDISELINTEFINQIYLTTDPMLYIVDINKISEKEQNILLKLLEEPNGLTYLILYGESTYNILETIVNRSYIMNMDKYDKSQLESLITDDEYKDVILRICSTPGQIEIANHTDNKSLLNLCKSMITRMSTAGLANALTITNKINFSDEYSKFDLDLFIRYLSYELLMNDVPNKKEILNILSNMKKNIWFMNDKKRYFDNFILNLWGLYRK